MIKVDLLLNASRSIIWASFFTDCWGNPDGRFSSPKGAFNDADGSFELSQAMKELRRAAYKPGSGTWFSMNMVVTSKGSATAEYNYDDEPQWDSPSPMSTTGINSLAMRIICRLG